MLNNVSGSRHERTCNYSVACVAGGRLKFSCLHSGVIVCGRRLIRENLRCTVVSRISSILVSRTHAPLVVSKRDNGSAELCRTYSVLTARVGHNRSIPRCSGVSTVVNVIRSRANSFVMGRGSGIMGLARSNIGGMRRFFRVRGLTSPRGLRVRRGVVLTLHTRGLVFGSRSCIMGSSRMLVMSRFAKHVVPNHHCSSKLRRTVRTGRRMGIGERDGALTAVAFRGFFGGFSGGTNVANATLARRGRFHSVCNVSIIRVPAGGPMTHVSLRSTMCTAGGRGFGTIISTIGRTRRGKRPILMNAVAVRASRLLDNVLGERKVPRAMLGTGFRRGRTRVITLTKRRNTIAVTAGVTNHNASVGLSSRTGTTKNLGVVNARHRRSEHVSGRLHKHTKHRKSPNRSRFFVSLRSSLVELFNSRHLVNIFGTLKMPRNRRVRRGVLASTVRGTRRGVRTGGFNVHGGLLRCSRISGSRERVVCDRHVGILGNSGVHSTVLGVIRRRIRGSISEYVSRRVSETS